MMVKCANINVEILKWARETAGFSINELSSSFKKLASWESNEEFPTYVQLEALAKKYKRPLAIFFFPEIPEEEDIKKSFRSLPDDQQDDIPPSVRFALREGRLFQINLMEIYDEKNPFKNQLITKNIKVEIDKNMQIFTDKVRSFLGIDIEEQKKWNDSSIAFKNWRDALFKKGIFVFKNALKSNNYSGFCLYHEIFPIIYINNSLPETRQIFTLFHELAHLLFQENHIEVFSLDNEYLTYSKNNIEKIEIFCNKFASEFLVPEDDFEIEINQERSSNIMTSTNILSKKYSVSREVILRRSMIRRAFASFFYPL